MTDYKRPIALLLLVPLTVALLAAGCGTNPPKTKAEYVAEYLSSAYDSCFDIDYSQTVVYTGNALAVEPSGEAFSLQAQAQYLMRSSAEAETTLASFEAALPNDGCANLLKAYFACLNTGEGDRILADLRSALTKDYGGLGYEGYWGMVEEFDGFSYFRDNFPVQYASLEAQKSAAPAVAATDGVTKFVKFHKVGPALYIRHADMWMIKAVRDLEALIASVAIPKPYNWIVKEVIKTRTVFINSKDKGRGVMMQWTVASWVPSITAMEAFWTYSQ